MKTQTLAQRIEQARQQNGFSKAQLARLSGISGASLSNLCSGQSKSMRQTTLLRMSKALHMTPSQLAYGEGGPELTPDELAPLSQFEQDFLRDLRKLNTVERKIVVRFVRSIVMDR